MKKHLFFIGYMGSGKTTVGNALSEMTGLPVLDMDEAISKSFDMPIRQIFDTFGEEAFRNAETELLREIADLEAPLIVSCGGGVPLRKENRDLLKENGKTILLEASIDELIKRLSSDNESENQVSRPLLNTSITPDSIGDMIEKRKAAYEEAANFTILTDGLTPTEIASRVIDLMNS